MPPLSRPRQSGRKTRFVSRHLQFITEIYSTAIMGLQRPLTVLLMDIERHCQQPWKERPAMSDFNQMLEPQIPRLRRYARALTRDAVRADDLVQSCLARALAKAHLWQPGTDLRAWLFTILHNQHVNDVRRAVREGINIPVEDVAPLLTVQSTQGASLQLRDLDRALE